MSRFCNAFFPKVSQRQMDVAASYMDRTDNPWWGMLTQREKEIVAFENIASPIPETFDHDYEEVMDLTLA